MLVDADRIDRLNATEETYVETIDVLMRKLGYAVVTDIAKKLDVKSPSVTSMLKRLDSLGFVKYTPYRNVNLTSKGKSLAVFLNRRHKSLQALLRLLGVDEVTAEKDACAIEHIVHASTLEKLEKFVDFVQNTPQGSVWLECFKNNELNGCELQNCPISSRATER